MGDALDAQGGMLLKVTCLGEGLGTMTTEVEVGDLLDIFDIEGVLLEHTNGHNIGLLGVLSNQTPDRSISGIDFLNVLGGLVHTDTQFESFLDFSELVYI